MQNPVETGPIGAGTAAKRKRYPRKSRVFDCIDLRTARGRRVKALYLSFMAQVSQPDNPADLKVQGAALKISKLTAVVDRLLNESLVSKKHNRRLGDELVRHENLLRRAKLELNAMTPEPVKWWEQEDDDDGEES